MVLSSRAKILNLWNDLFYLKSFALCSTRGNTLTWHFIDPEPSSRPQQKVRYWCGLLDQESATSSLWPKFAPPLVFISQVVTEPSHAPRCVCYPPGPLHQIGRTERSHRCDRDQMTCKAETIYQLALYRKSSLTPNLSVDFFYSFSDFFRGGKTHITFNVVTFFFFFFEKTD